MEKLKWSNPWLELPETFFQRVAPTPLEGPFIIHCNERAGRLLGLSVDRLGDETALHSFNGERLPDGVQPIATVYAGHQFGIYTSQLGDGRALLLGELRGEDSKRYEIQLKGAGLTPYSRTMNGRSELASAIREYLAGEALAGLGIPASRGLCLLGSRSLVPGGNGETAAILVRMARSHLRFGHFEYFHHGDDWDALRELFDFAVERQFPELLNLSKERRPLAFLQTVVERTASLIAAWQSAGFTHGVINTDNMTVSGETLDLGPYGFIEGYDPGFTPNPSDDQHRYQFDQQPDIGRWNCLALAQALTSLLPSPTIPASLLRLYRQSYQQHYLSNMRAKLGLHSEQAGDNELLNGLLPLLAHSGTDYPSFFLSLAEFDPGADRLSNSDEAFHPLLNPWLKNYRDRLKLENITQRERREKMKRVNPCYVLRRHLVEHVVSRAEQGDYSELHTVVSLLQSPFEERRDGDYYRLPPVNDPAPLAMRG